MSNFTDTMQDYIAHLLAKIIMKEMNKESNYNEELRTTVLLATVHRV